MLRLRMQQNIVLKYKQRKEVFKSSLTLEGTIAEASVPPCPSFLNTNILTGNTEKGQINHELLRSGGNFDNFLPILLWDKGTCAHLNVKF